MLILALVSTDQTSGVKLIGSLVIIAGVREGTNQLKLACDKCNTVIECSLEEKVVVALTM